MMKVFFVVLCLSAFALATELTPRGGSTSAATLPPDPLTCLLTCIVSLVAQITAGLLETICGLLVTLEGLLDTVIGTVVSLLSIVTALADPSCGSIVAGIIGDLKILGFVLNVIKTVEQDLFCNGLLSQLVQTLFALPLAVVVTLHQLTSDLVNPACTCGLGAITQCIGIAVKL